MLSNEKTLRYLRNSEANASELPKNPEEVFPRYLCLLSGHGLIDIVLIIKESTVSSKHYLSPNCYHLF